MEATLPRDALMHRWQAFAWFLQTDQIMAKRSAQINHWQNWAVFGSRWIVIFAVMAAVYTLRMLDNRAELPDDLIALSLVAGIANLTLAPIIVLRHLYPYAPYVIIAGNWVIAGALVWMGEGSLFVAVLVTATLASMGWLRLGWQVGTVAAVGTVAIAGGALWIAQPTLFNAPMNLLVPLMAGGGMALSVGLWVYLRDREAVDSVKMVRELEQELIRELETLRENNQAVIEMAARLGSTLSYERILDTALDVGRLCLNPDNTSRLAGIVMLFKAGRNTLYIENSRGINRLDEGREIVGKAGIVGKALEECMPIIGGGTAGDPELREFVTFGTAQSMLCIPLRAGYDNYGVLLFGSEDPDAFNTERITTLQAISTQVTVALQNAVLYNNLVEEKERLIEMEENARKALVRDLHDIPTQTISALTMRIRIIQRLLTSNRGEEALKELENVDEMAQRATEEIRHVLFKLRPLALESQGLSAALEQLAEKTMKVYKQKVSLRIAEGVERYLDHNAQGAIFYLIEEAVSNARKYAQAEQISVAIGRKGDLLMVRISDNGIGFDTKSINNNYEERGSFGMVNMRERAEILGGTLTLESEPGRGTKITVVIPLDERMASRQATSNRNGRVPQTKLALSAMDRVTRKVRGY